MKYETYNLLRHNIYCLGSLSWTENQGYQFERNNLKALSLLTLPRTNRQLMFLSSSVWSRKMNHFSVEMNISAPILHYHIVVEAQCLQTVQNILGFLQSGSDQTIHLSINQVHKIYPSWKLKKQSQ